jgi:hypothetical protein
MAYFRSQLGLVKLQHGVSLSSKIEIPDKRDGNGIRLLQKCHGHKQFFRALPL